MEAEFCARLLKLASDPPSAAELEAAHNHFLGRGLSSAQSNEELTGELAREFSENRTLDSHDQLRAELKGVTGADLEDAAHRFVHGTIIRVDVPRALS